MLDRIRVFAKTNLKPASDLESFLREVEATRSGDIVVSDDRVRFAAANKVFRTSDSATAERLADLLEDFYDKGAEAPLIKRS